ncbi:uncharacterized protein ARMOST_11971 [Armillaria ostoyae]|uniref:Arrestin-like N-terminal domain-containing protein n=1 Tax=Armillaria ostoyae TaxID=47428 RepID=A0A284RIM3_ARMOS|nr:uncharacterized protein ARMOST_11971 [Armillaria ostoyae]
MQITSPRSNGKLVGTREWHFSIPIPREVIVAPGTSLYLTAEDIGPFRLPPPFHEISVLADIQYTLVASIKRLGRLRGNAKIYVPIIRPGPPTILRQLACQENSPLPGPEVDPEGWQQLPPALLEGTVFKDQEVEIQCTFYLAKPLCYAKGTVEA